MELLRPPARFPLQSSAVAARGWGGGLERLPVPPHRQPDALPPRRRASTSPLRLGRASEAPSVTPNESPDTMHFLFVSPNGDTRLTFCSRDQAHALATVRGFTHVPAGHRDFADDPPLWLLTATPDNPAMFEPRPITAAARERGGMPHVHGSWLSPHHETIEVATVVEEKVDVLTWVDDAAPAPVPPASVRP